MLGQAEGQGHKSREAAQESYGGMMEFEFPALFVTILNAFLPLAIQFLKQKITSHAGRYFLAFILSGVTAIIGIIWQGQWDMANLLGMFALAVAAGQTAYHLFWHNLLTNGR